MHTIHKYKLQITDEQTIMVPGGSRVISTGLDGDGDLCVWAEVRTDFALARRTIWIVGTGQPFPTMENRGRFLGSVLHEGSLVWHVFTSDAE